jgi:dephospho-CoA kinase
MILRIGLTGGIGSGKSVVAGLFTELGVPVIDADIITRSLVEPGQPALALIATRLGEQFVTAAGTLDRVRLREYIFSNDDARIELESILHPLVYESIRGQTQELTGPYCIIVIPLLIEANQKSLVDRVLVVDAPEETCIGRVMARDNSSREAVQIIMKTQLDRESRLRHADDIIVNDKDIETLRQEVLRLHRQYLTISKNG